MEKNIRDYLTDWLLYFLYCLREEKVSFQEAQNQEFSISEVKYKRLKERVKRLVKEI